MILVLKVDQVWDIGNLDQDLVFNEINDALVKVADRYGIGAGGSIQMVDYDLYQEKNKGLLERALDYCIGTQLADDIAAFLDAENFIYVPEEKEGPTMTQAKDLLFKALELVKEAEDQRVELAEFEGDHGMPVELGPEALDLSSEIVTFLESFPPEHVSLVAEDLETMLPVTDEGYTPIPF